MLPAAVVTAVAAVVYFVVSLHVVANSTRRCALSLRLLTAGCGVSVPPPFCFILEPLEK